MRIADEIRHILDNFVPGVIVFRALCKAEKINEYQAASWFVRHIDELNEVPMYEVSVSRQDFHFPEESWASDVFHSLLYPDRSGGSLGWEPEGDGYVGGWLRPDIEAFFQSTGVDMPDLRLGVDLDSQDPDDGSSLAPEPASTLPAGENVESLSTKERITLLCIIGTIARESKFDIARPSKAATVIVDSAASIGVKLGQRTVEEWLKRVPEALDRRST